MSPSSPTRSTADVEALLRRTYDEVAARTTVEPAVLGGDARLAPVDLTGPRRWQPGLAAAAALAVLIGGLWLIVGRDTAEPAGRGTPTHLVPGWVPRSTGPDGDGALFPLVDLETGDGNERFRYATDDGSIVLEARRGGALPVGHQVEVRGVVGVRDGSSMSWLDATGPLVTVSWDGAVDAAMVDAFVRGLVGADDPMWAELTAHAGFRRIAESGPLATFRIDADEDFDVELVGDPHQGLSLRVGPIGLPASIDRCSSSVNYEVGKLREFGDPDARGPIGYLVVAPGDLEQVAIVAGGRRSLVELTSLAPFTDVSIGGVVLDDRLPSDDLPEVDCGEEAP